MPEIDLVVTDLDGTLWGADERVHARTLATLADLQARPLPVIAATGRRVRGAKATLDAVGVRLPGLVALDGAIGHDLDAGRVFHRAAFPPQAAVAVLGAFRAAGLSPCVYVDRADAEVLVGHRPSTHPRHVALVGPWLRAADLDAVVAGEPVLMFSVVGGDDEVLGPVAEAIGPLAGVAAVTRDVVVGGWTITVRPPGISKWQGVVAWCAEQGLDPGRVLAIGDGRNDLELLASAKVACAIADGCEEALAIADHVLEPPAAGGWSAVAGLLR